MQVTGMKFAVMHFCFLAFSVYVSLCFKARNINFVPVVIEIISAMDDTRKGVLKMQLEMHLKK